ncbi:MAG: fructosamine kinase family protein [Lachnospiraceae bacterium]|nr:fructosamine kinase family protein [Lachnospiraceae bacterium]
MGIAEDAVRAACGDGITLRSARPVSGGDINGAYLLELSDGRELFLKTNRRENIGFFESEREGLLAIAETGSICVPEVISTGTSQDGAYLLMQFVRGRQENPGYWEHFAESLAGMHRADASGLVPGGRYGFHSDNYIGAGIQINTPCDSWIVFFRDYRLKVQLDRASRYFGPKEKVKADRLLARLPELLVEPEKPALLHGDLWSGNFITGGDGWAWLIDPAAYVGHPEADIAMTELFGGFGRRFYEAYRETGLIQYGYGDRRDIYNLYHLLNHLNLFGGGYFGSCLRILERY